MEEEEEGNPGGAPRCRNQPLIECSWSAPVFSPREEKGCSEAKMDGVVWDLSSTGLFHGIIVTFFFFLFFFLYKALIKLSWINYDR